MNREKFRQNIQQIQERIANAATKSGRSPEDVKLIAVTKKVTVECIDLLYEEGIVNIGENKVFDAKEKREQSKHAEKINWHMIGHLQRNKVRHANFFPYIHSIDSYRLAEEVDKRFNDVNVFLQVNVSGEDSKHGFTPDELPSEYSRILSLKNLKVIGLMTMAPLYPDREAWRNCFRGLKELSHKLQQDFPNSKLTELSMGMSGDFEVAIEEGATMVRVGSALYEGVFE